MAAVHIIVVMKKRIKITGFLRRSNIYNQLNNYEFFQEIISIIISVKLVVANFHFMLPFASIK